jgi:hypothetical protein
MQELCRREILAIGTNTRRHSKQVIGATADADLSLHIAGDDFYLTDFNARRARFLADVSNGWRMLRLGDYLFSDSEPWLTREIFILPCLLFFRAFEIAAEALPLPLLSVLRFRMVFSRVKSAATPRYPARTATSLHKCARYPLATFPLYHERFARRLPSRLISTIRVIYAMETNAKTAHDTATGESLPAWLASGSHSPGLGFSSNRLHQDASRDLKFDHSHAEITAMLAPPQITRKREMLSFPGVHACSRVLEI